MPTHFKAIFLQAREHSKLGEINIASELIKRIKICTELNNEEYMLHFKILESLNNNESTEDLEKLFLKELRISTKNLYITTLRNI